MRVDATSYEDASQRVARWARDGRSAYVCVATVHMTMEAFDSSAFQRVVNDLLKTFVRILERRYPGVQVVCQIAPPFRPLTPEEDETVTKEIVSSGARVLFVGIGCPKQERWMETHKDRIPAVMLGVGAAFDFHTGRVRQAPGWMQVAGLEWLFRLLMDPKRLWKRYAKHNPRFVVLFLLEHLGLLQFGRKQDW
jgi:N-acetylglucosaminyldiphosphoundecaprenol N-acetyl-beta-D-mannosaminyltransferase